MLARLSAFVIWALVAATAVFWGLRLFVRAPAVPAYAVPVGDAAAGRGDLTRLLGAAPVQTAAALAAPETSSRFRLLGIVAPTHASGSSPSLTNGVALIAVDGKMPKAYVVGARVDGDLVLRSVSLRTVSIAPSAPGAAAAITLELPPLASAATGSLPAIGGVGGGAAPAVAVPAYVPPAYVPPAFPAPVAVPGGLGTPGVLPPMPVTVPNRPEPGAPTE